MCFAGSGQSKDVYNLHVKKQKNTSQFFFACGMQSKNVYDWHLLKQRTQKISACGGQKLMTPPSKR
jgi:phage-related protein